MSKSRRRPARKRKSEVDHGKLAKFHEQTIRSIKKWTLQKAIPQTDDGIQLDPWQKEAVELLLAGTNVIVDAPTTAGKTRVVETLIRMRLEEDRFRAVYTTPVKSLSNDKYVEFKQIFGESQVGIATGDIKENLNAPIVIATLETYRNSLLGIDPDLGRSIAIFDEYHFIQDRERGSAWEEAIILGPESTQILMLSASVDNPEEVCGWLQKIKRSPSRVVCVKDRPVPLVDLIYYKGGWVCPEFTRLPSVPRHSSSMRFPIDHSELAERISGLSELNLLPCIIYGGQRLQCENLAGELVGYLAPLDANRSKSLMARLKEMDRQIDCLRFLSKNLHLSIVHYGVAYHHSGLGLPARLAIETLLKAGDLTFCVATMGLSLGVNFAVRSALISDYRRPGSAGFVMYPPTEILQMLGRAGRRGQDVVGFSLWPNLASYQKFMPCKRESLRSQIRHDPATFLGLISRNYSLKRIERFYDNSLMASQNKKSNFKVVSPDLVKRFLNRDLPCLSAGHEFSQYSSSQPSKCSSCELKKKCHPFIQKCLKGNLASLHIHLHSIGCLNELEKLTEFGDAARFFPQSGGLAVAYMYIKGQFTAGRFIEVLELMAALSLPRFKEPRVLPSYRFPFKVKDVRKVLEELYPMGLFPDYYDPPYGQRFEYVYKDFNWKAGSFMREWLMGAEFHDLAKRVCHSKFAKGDMMNVFYRAGTLLLSLSQIASESESSELRALWKELLRPPLSSELG